ncbi:MAG: hypothetical protein J6T63_06110 [Bacteroidales bacterium]|nr:hypothetical protein [Bacteroidales bacterium]
MKRIVLLIIIMTVAVVSYAQLIPQTVNFSAIVRDADSLLLVNTPVTVKISIIAGGQYGTTVYCAEHNAVTDVNGFVSIQLNRGEHTCGCNGALNIPFAGIPWHQGNIWLRVEYRTDGDYVNLGTREIASNYYALVSRKAEKLSNINFYVNNAQDGEVLVYRDNVDCFLPVALDSIYYNGLPTPPMSDVIHRGNSADGRRISGLANPINSGDAVTKSYVDSLVSVINATAEHLFDPPVIVAPEVITLSYRNLTSNSVTFYGSVYYNGGESVTCGFVYGTDEQNMTDTVVADSDAGEYSYEVSGLQPFTNYYYKAFATNSVATTFGAVRSFKTATEAGSCITGSFTDTRDGNVYATVTIGDQTWMAENLRFRGNLPLLTGVGQYVVYPNDDSTNVELYGYLYSQEAALNGTTMSSQIPSGLRGVCPYGWHLPSEGEWRQLINMYDRTIASQQLAGSPELWTRSNQMYVENANFGASCFNAVPAGVYDRAGGYDNQFQAFGMYAIYWTSTGNEEQTCLKDISIGYTLCGLSIDQLYGSWYVESVRCVRDN